MKADGLIKIGEAARILGLRTTTTLARYEKRGLLYPAYKSEGGTRWYRKEDVEKFLEESKRRKFNSIK